MSQIFTCFHMSRVVRKPEFCICENKDADQLRGNHEADQRLCFRYTDSTIPLLSKSKISSFHVRLHDGPDLKLFILVGWDRSFCLLLGPPGLN